MMKRFLPIALLAGACSPQSPEPSMMTGNFSGQGRDRLCIAGHADNLRAGLITYGNGDINCTANGRLEAQGANLTLVPRGEGACRIPLAVEGEVVRIGVVPPSCAYYCGPGARLAGRTFTRSANATPAADLVGDPLC